MGLPTTAAGFDQVQVHVDFLSGKVHAVPTKSTDTAADAAKIILEMALRSGDGIPDVLVVDHDPKSPAPCFESSRGVLARVFSSAQRTTRIPMPRRSASTGC